MSSTYVADKEEETREVRVLLRSDTEQANIIVWYAARKVCIAVECICETLIQDI